MVCGTSLITTKVHLFRTHHNVFNYFKFLLCLANCSIVTLSIHYKYIGFSSFIIYGSLALSTHLICSFCPIYFTHLCGPPYTVYISTIQVSHHLFQYIYFLQFPLHTASFHTAFHITIFTRVFISYFIKVSMGLIHFNLGSFITAHITLFLLCGPLILKLTTCTIFSMFLPLSDTSLILLYSIKNCVCIYINPLSNWFIFTNISCFNL